ncbi:Bor family protein [Leeuwenhoekiella sp. MAR_2009_132]|uniref:Bor family protein n=1 Tax=Leeuwenhoekiella sp. MAR_2009_132 TaxID=1392489 RepID=UPI00068F345B|nr:Bor family protein [Leeuwenhoekiella sp. MAR_2009_132]
MNKFQQLFIVGALALMATSCYVQTSVVGAGAKGNTEVTQWNHYLIGGLAPVGVSKPEVMANGAKDYTVTTKHSFVNGLVNAITFGLYTPTTTIVKY